MTTTMRRFVCLFAVLTLVSVLCADAACATSQTFKALQPSVRAKRTRAKRRPCGTLRFSKGPPKDPQRNTIARRTLLHKLTPFPPSIVRFPQQTGLGTDPYEVEWITTQSGKVRDWDKEKGHVNRLSSEKSIFQLVSRCVCVLCALVTDHVVFQTTLNPKPNPKKP